MPARKAVQVEPIWANAFGLDADAVRTAVVEALNKLPQTSPLDTSLIEQSLQHMPDAVAHQGWSSYYRSDRGVVVTAVPNPAAVQARYVAIRGGAVEGYRFARIAGTDERPVE